MAAAVFSRFTASDQSTPTADAATGAMNPTSSTGMNGAFLDAGMVHEIAATFDQTAFDAMIETYRGSGD